MGEPRDGRHGSSSETFEYHSADEAVHDKRRQDTLTLQEADEGECAVTSPLDLQRITEAEAVKEAFENACDALAALAASRRRLIRELAGVKA